MRTSIAVALVSSLTLSSCSEDTSKPQDSGTGPDVQVAEDAGVDVTTGISCAAIQTCAQDCSQEGYAECLAACRAPASEKAKALLKAYEDCAATTMDNECQEECVAGPADQLCGKCVLPHCITYWNNCSADN